MVRNTTGGSKTKSMARKSTTPTTIVVDYIPKDALERVAKVTKMYGNGMCQVVTQDHPQLDLMCYIRGKFKGKSKKHNMISLNSKVVIGLRDWENPYKNSDLISVLSSYDDPMSTSNCGGAHSSDDSFIFSNEEVHEHNDILPQKIPNGTIIEEDDEINIDDI
jgi:hypothetical protein